MISNTFNRIDRLESDVKFYRNLSVNLQLKLTELDKEHKLLLSKFENITLRVRQATYVVICMSLTVLVKIHINTNSLNKISYSDHHFQVLKPKN